MFFLKFFLIALGSTFLLVLGFLLYLNLNSMKLSDVLNHLFGNHGAGEDKEDE